MIDKILNIIEKVCVFLLKNSFVFGAFGSMICAFVCMYRVYQPYMSEIAKADPDFVLLCDYTGFIVGILFILVLRLLGTIVDSVCKRLGVYDK